MRIRAGFVANSSSTSFLILTHGDLNRADFFELVGVAPDSPVADLFGQLFADLLESTAHRVDFATTDDEVPAESWFLQHDKRLSLRMIEKLREAKERGLTAYYGWLSSDNDMVETFFCTDSFELENDKMYVNGLECIW